MRTRAFVVVALLALPAGLSGQGIRIPRTGGLTPTEPAPLPREIPVVARAMAYRRSQWSAEAYSLMSAVRVPGPSGSATTYGTFGAGTRAGYRPTEHVSATVDLTMSTLGGNGTSQTAELGTRFQPLSWDRQIRPFFDVRAAYVRMSDNLMFPMQTGGIPGSNQGYMEGTRYSRGFGGVAGGGLEFPVTNSVAVSAGLTAIRSQMTVYRLTNLTSLPVGSNYWMTSVRFALGVRFNPVRSMQLAQNPTS